MNFNKRREIRLVFLLLVLAFAAIPACSSVPVRQQTGAVQKILIAGIVIRNELLFPVTDVMINAPETGAFAGCGNLMSRSECSTSFEAVAYSAGKLVVSWKEYGQPHTTGEFVIEIPEGMDRGKAAWLEVVIYAMGQAGARLVQF